MVCVQPTPADSGYVLPSSGYEALHSELRELVKPKSWVLLLRKFLIARPVKVILLGALIVSVIITFTSNVKIHRKVQTTLFKDKTLNSGNDENWLLVATPRLRIINNHDDQMEPVANWMLLNRHSSNKRKHTKKESVKD